MSAKREDNLVAGFSMGGYGALKAALTYPDRYFACASLSGALDITRVHCVFSWEKKHYEYIHNIKQNIFCEN